MLVNMKSHPSPEQWMAYLYADDTPAEHGALDEHLRSCAHCQRQVQKWRDTTRALDAWRMPEPRHQVFPARRLRWAAAAAVLVCTGVLFGRFSTRLADAQ